MEKIRLKNMLSIIAAPAAVNGNGHAVCKDDIDRILRATMIAPSASRMLPWKFIIVKGRHALQSMVEKLPVVNRSFTAECCIVLCVLPEETAMSDEPTAMQDCKNAGENMLLAAETTGLAAACFEMYHNKEMMSQLRSLLKIPEQVIPFSVIAIGGRK